MRYIMSKTETEQWVQNARVKHPSNISTNQTYCRDLIRTIAKDKGATSIHDDTGALVE